LVKKISSIVFQIMSGRQWLQQPAARPLVGYQCDVVANSRLVFSAFD
jgi:hypothetical protein